MKKIYSAYLNALETNDKSNIIYTIFLDSQCSWYLDNTSNQRKVIDFISGMTDELFLHQVKKYLVK